MYFQTNLHIHHRNHKRKISIKRSATNLDNYYNTFLNNLSHIYTHCLLTCATYCPTRNITGRRNKVHNLPRTGCILNSSNKSVTQFLIECKGTEQMQCKTQM